LDFNFVNFFIAIGLGALIGLEREFEIQRKNRPDIAGLRTFVLMALFGAISGFLAMNVFDSNFLLITFAGLALLITVAYAMLSKSIKDRILGITTEVAAFATFILGVMCVVGYSLQAVIVSIVVVIFLALKKPMHGFVKRIKLNEIYATLKFAVVTLLILPFLPNINYTPMDIPILSKIIEVAPFLSTEVAKQLNVFNPFKIWLMVVFISGISFVGYILIRIIGAGKGLGMTGLLGGLVSSTAVTSSMSLESKKTTKIIFPFVLAVIIACSTMFIRVLIEVLVVNASLLKYTVPILIMGIAGFLGAFFVWTKIKKEPSKEVEFKSPFTLAPALKFAVFFAFILFISKAGSIFLGAKGIYIAAFVSGLADVDAITLSMATLAGAGDISAAVAAIGITIAAMTNTIVKGGIVYLFGASDFRKKTIVILGITVFLGFLSILIFLLPQI
jgi:uncharacterized membrane protein (DUF4010 family)